MVADNDESLALDAKSFPPGPPSDVWLASDSGDVDRVAIEPHYHNFSSARGSPRLSHTAHERQFVDD